ncbi:hypothetical protein K431DRAFT_53086 [Polychaeton citri CBS 116435]|uniref:Uncharacterized protein n=1 Tax=Polychaeton citri CBS 116435 TaxID=1314669 RepID=A0A9P4QEI1_9PEZI|nr:hypothetical protein K431DRAFT_53086 [Polychaeton citri CBS 116435]
MDPRERMVLLMIVVNVGFQRVNRSQRLPGGIEEKGKRPTEDAHCLTTFGCELRRSAQEKARREREREPEGGEREWASFNTGLCLELVISGAGVSASSQSTCPWPKRTRDKVTTLFFDCCSLHCHCYCYPAITDHLK